MRLSEIAFFTDKLGTMTEFYRRSLGADSVTRSKLMEQGLRLEIPPQDFDWDRFAYLRDPDGHQIEIIRMEKSHAG